MQQTALDAACKGDSRMLLNFRLALCDLDTASLSKLAQAVDKDLWVVSGNARNSLGEVLDAVYDALGDVLSEQPIMLSHDDVVGDEPIVELHDGTGAIPAATRPESKV